MSSDVTSARGSTAAMIGDACLFTAVTIAAGPLALLIGPAAAWLLHGRRIDRGAVIGGVTGVAIGVVSVGGFIFTVAVLLGAIGPVGGSESAGPIALLATAGAMFLAVLVALDVDAVRDLAPARRIHTRLDIARLVSTLIIALATVVVRIVQATNPATEIGDAGVFALAAGAVGAVTTLVGNTIQARWEKRSGVGGGGEHVVEPEANHT